MKEQRRSYYGSTYWLRSGYGPAKDKWIVTADGVALGPPTTYEQALKALDDVAPIEPKKNPVRKLKRKTTPHALAMKAAKAKGYNRAIPISSGPDHYIFRIYKAGTFEGENFKIIKSKGVARKNPLQRRKHARPGGARRVPPEQFKQANKLFESFSGDQLKSAKKLNLPWLAKNVVVMKIGTIDGILYTTVRDGKTERYIHEFKSKARPTFAVSPDGKQLFMLGGAYNFTERGIVDKR